MKNNNIILIGMPAAGKSTIGRILAKSLKYEFLDSDRVIEQVKGKTLEAIIEEVGTDGFNQVEEDVNASIQAKNTVIATGGSVVYGPKAMEHFRQIGTVVFIKLDIDEIASRVGDFKKRGISIKEGMTFNDLYDERRPLYEKYAHITVDTTGLKIGQSVEKIKTAVLKYNCKEK